MFHEQYGKQERLFKSHEESILSIINSNIKIQHNNWISLMKSRRKCQQNRETDKAKKQFLAYHHRCLCNR